jgi:hypothetical protein
MGLPHEYGVFRARALDAGGGAASFDVLAAAVDEPRAGRVHGLDRADVDRHEARLAGFAGEVARAVFNIALLQGPTALQRGAQAFADGLDDVTGVGGHAGYSGGGRSGDAGQAIVRRAGRVEEADLRPSVGNMSQFPPYSWRALALMPRL